MRVCERVVTTLVTTLYPAFRKSRQYEEIAIQNLAKIPHGNAVFVQNYHEYGEELSVNPWLTSVLEEKLADISCFSLKDWDVLSTASESDNGTFSSESGILFSDLCFLESGGRPAEPAMAIYS